MNDIILIISKILPVILLIILGNVFQRIDFLKKSTIVDLKKIIVNVALPALLFIAFSQTKFQIKYFLIVGVVFAVCVLMLFIGKLFQNLFNIKNNYVPSLFAGFETGMMGYSIFVAIYGSVNMYKLAIIDLGQVVFVFFILVSYLQKLNGGILSGSELALSFIKSPVIIAIFLGILSGSFGVLEVVNNFSMLNGSMETIKLISSLTVPIICIVIGYELHINLNSFRLPMIVASFRVSILVILAFIINTFLIDKFLHLDNTFKIALYTMFILPPPFVIPIFMRNNDEEDKQFILNTISINIILSLIVYIGIIAII